MSNCKSNNRCNKFWVLILLLLFSFALITPAKVYAQEARLYWQNVTEMSPQGDFTLGLSGEVPTTVSAFEFVITYDAEQIEFLDYNFLISGMNSGIDDSVPGALTFTADGANLAEGSYDFANLNFKMKVAGESSVTLARSYFISGNGDEIPATMMLSQGVSLASLESPESSISTESTVPSSSSTGESGATTSVSSSSTSAGQTVSTSVTETSKKSSESEAEKKGSSAGLKFALILGSLVLVGLIYLILKLPRNTKNTKNTKNIRKRPRN